VAPDQAVRLRLMTPIPARPRLTMTTSEMAAMSANFEIPFMPIPSLVSITDYRIRRKNHANLGESFNFRGLSSIFWATLTEL